MDQAKIENTLKKLADEIGVITHCEYKNLPSESDVGPDTNRTIEQTVDTLQESLDFLRLCIKYQAYDLEATRRENRYLKKLLEQDG